jgi:Flp pilus assembly protein TadD
LSRGRNAEAVKPLQAARNGYPGGERVEARLHLVKILTALGREAEAEPIRKELATLYEASAGHESKVAILVAEGRTVEALPLLAEASSRKPDDTMLAMKVAALQIWFGRNADHAATSQRMLAWAADTASAEVAERVAKLAHPLGGRRPGRRPPVPARSSELGKAHQPWHQLALAGISQRSICRR